MGKKDVVSPLEAVQEIKEELQKFKSTKAKEKLDLDKDFFKEYIKYIYQSS